MTCLQCGIDLSGKKKRYCSTSCRQRFWTDARQIGARRMDAILAESVSSKITPVPILTIPMFDGKTYNHTSDHARLSKQYERVFDLMRDGTWRTLDEISKATGDQHQSVSARLRDFRKLKFGGHTVDRKHRGPKENGLFEYRLILNSEKAA